MPFRGHTGGFTLIEMLLSLAMLSVLMAALYGTLFVSKRTVDLVGDSLVSLQEARTLIDRMTREISSAIFSKEKSHTLFKVTDRDYYGKQVSQIAFTTVSPKSAGLARIEYGVEKTGETMKLRMAFASAASGGEPQISDLMESIDSFTVEVRQGKNWIRTWDSTLTGTAPEEVRISIALKTEKSGSGSGSVPIVLTGSAMPMAGKNL